MYFKLDYTAKALDLGERDGLQLEVQRPRGSVTITLSQFEEAELRRRGMKGDLRCEATTERWTFTREEVMFDAIGKEVPNGIKPLADEVRNELGRCIHSTLHNIRWNRGLTQPHNPIRYGSGLMWSVDGSKWKTLPGEMRLNGRIGVPTSQWMKEDEIDRIKSYVETGVDEPLGHHLLSEAWSQANENPRSALVMGIAAAETGWKEFVAGMLPQTKWLLENIPSPPLDKMLREFMPLISVKANFTGRRAIFPATMLATLKTGVTYRNKTVHGSSPALDSDGLDAVLRAVRELLYMLDLYNGLLWAAAHISPETIAALEKE